MCTCQCDTLKITGDGDYRYSTVTREQGLSTGPAVIYDGYTLTHFFQETPAICQVVEVGVGMSDQQSAQVLTSRETSTLTNRGKQGRKTQANWKQRGWLETEAKERFD